MTRLESGKHMKDASSVILDQLRGVHMGNPGQQI
jgi:hypothetical protein